MSEKIINNLKSLVGIISIVIVTFGCNSDPNGLLVREIKKCLSDSHISSEECDTIRQLIASDENLQSELSKEDELKSYINDVATKMAESRRGGNISLPIKMDCFGNIDTLPTTESQEPKFNFYIENSGSMYGYMSGVSDFKKATLGLMTKINRYGEEINMNFVNDEIHPVKEQFEDFMKYLDPKSLRTKGDVKNSNLTQTLNMVIEDILDDSTTAVLLSDFIFSINHRKDVRDELDFQRFGITAIISKNQLEEKGYGFLVIKFNSKFTGKYYKLDNTHVTLDNQDRPYYVWVIGKNETLVDFIRKYEIKELDGYKNSFIVSNANTSTDQFYTILRSSDNQIGRFNIDRNSTNANSINAIEDVKISSRENCFQFSIAFENNGLPVEDDYFLEKNNYEIKSDLGDAFELVKVEEAGFGNIEKLDKEYLNKVDYIVTLKAEKVAPGKQDIHVALKRHIPEWIKESSTDDDLDIGDTNEDIEKTFGFYDLMLGVLEDYTPLGDGEDNYFELTVSIKR